MNLSFLRNLGIVTVVHAVAGLLALVYNMIVSRRLGVADYGLFQAIMAIYSTLTIFVGPLNMATAHCVATCEDSVRPCVVGKFVRFALWVGGGCSGVVICSSLWLTELLHSSVFPFIWLAALVLATAVLTTFYGALQALGAYLRYAVAKVSESLIGLVVGSLLVVGGAGTSGAVLGYVLGMMSILLFFSLRRSFYSFGPSTYDAGAELRAFVNILIAYGLIFFVGDFPVVLARSRLSAELSGLYGALYNLRNLVLPFCLALATPLYSRTVSAPDGHKTFLQVLVPVLGLGAAFLGVGVLCPRLPFRFIYGAAFVKASDYMTLYGVALALQMVSVITIFYQVARRRLLLIGLLVPVVVIVIGMILPGLTIRRIIVAQSLAWASFLACASLRRFVISLASERARIS